MSTLKQKKALANVVGNGGNVTKAMIDAGYSVATANTPQKLTESKAFIAYMEEAGLTDESLITTIKEGLVATKVIVMGKDSSESFVDITPDHPTRHKFLETALRLKGHSSKESSPIGNTFIQVNNDMGKKYV